MAHRPMPDLTVTPGVASGRDAFAMAGITPADVDVFEPYDNFTHAVLLYLEDLGFCEKGEAGSLRRRRPAAPGRQLARMTSGGGLSYCHPGALGILLLIEAVRQLRGEAGDRQVPTPRSPSPTAPAGSPSRQRQPWCLPVTESRILRRPRRRRPDHRAVLACLLRRGG